MAGGKTPNLEEVIMAKKLKKSTTKSKAKVTAPVVETTYKRLTKEEYAKALQHPKWQKKRLKIMERDNWRCRECKNTEAQLHVHHLAYTKRWPWNEENDNLITYCNACHARAHKLVKR